MSAPEAVNIPSGDLDAPFTTFYAQLSRFRVHLPAMTIQSARRNNLRALVAELQHQGVDDWDEIARRVGCTAGAPRLRSMLDKGFIGSWFSHCLEHSLNKPRRWLDEDRTPSPDRPTESDAPEMPDAPVIRHSRDSR